MHHDQKVGLALGVLLIGAVAAFFFRNESQSGASFPTLQHSADVNREIAEKRLTPYFPNIEADSAKGNSAARSGTNAVGAHDARTGERPLAASDVSPLDDSPGSADPFAGDTATPVPAPAPDPIRLENAKTGKNPSLGDASTEKPLGNDVDSVEAARAAAAPEQPVHEVQKGETLSSIAGKYLGSQARYQDLFDANRDLLKNPNDLQVGMKLKIPAPTNSGMRKEAAAPIAPLSHRSTIDGADSEAVKEVSSEKHHSAEIINRPASADGATSAAEGNADIPAAASKAKFTPSRRHAIPAGAKP